MNMSNNTPTLTSPGALEVVLRRGLGVLNLVGAFAIAIALSINIADRVIQGIFNPTHYFHFFTIQSSIIDIVVLLVGGILAVTRTQDSRWYSVVRASTVAYAIVVGVVYNVLLAGIASTDGYVASFEFPNTIEHIAAPLFLVIEWVLMPGRARINWGTMWICAVFPLAWVAGSMVRGLVGDGWFPYFFFDPAQVGVGGVALYIVAIAAFILGNYAVMAAIGRVHARLFASSGANRAAS